MEGLEHILTRREFIRLVTLGAGAAALNSMPTTAFQQSRRSALKRGIPYNIKSLPIVIPSSSKRKITLSSEDVGKYTEQAWKESPFLRGIMLEPVDAYEEIWLRFEPDRRYAEGLIKEAKLSIDDMINFLDTPHIPRQELSFRVPQTATDVTYFNIPKMLFYLVAEVGNKKTITFRFNFNGIYLPKVLEEGNNPSAEDGILGESTRGARMVTTNKGSFLTNYKESPIFYSTSSSPLKLIETPPLEYLHKCLEPITIKHLQSAIRNVRNAQGAVRIGDRYMAMEEKFVHALSILWWTHYNKNFGFPQQELDAKFMQYEAHEEYRGVIKLSERIRYLGIKKAIVMYVNSPEALFKGIN